MVTNPLSFDKEDRRNAEYNWPMKLAECDKNAVQARGDCSLLLGYKAH